MSSSQSISSSNSEKHSEDTEEMEPLDRYMYMQCKQSYVQLASSPGPILKQFPRPYSQLSIVSCWKLGIGPVDEANVQLPFECNMHVWWALIRI